MSDLNPYEQLEVAENATFEEIQESRNRLMAQYSGDKQRKQSIEVAYDAILMERLRMRQENKIKVPERIRYPEKAAESAPSAPPIASQETPGWLEGLLDTPSTPDILWPAAAFSALSILALVVPTATSLSLALGVGFSLYFLHSKERRFGRAFLISTIVLVVGLALGTPLGNAIAVPEMQVSIAAFFTFFLFWLAASFLR
ncbi:MAG: molecular chaperone DnaJ [Oscillatoria sp. SIO1A7]|nr:molecular chaperone DnaJ [Oscillatoria sp. SIO1A7]